MAATEIRLVQSRAVPHCVDKAEKCANMFGEIELIFQFEFCVNYSDFPDFGHDRYRCGDV